MLNLHLKQCLKHVWGEEKKGKAWDGNGTVSFAEIAKKLCYLFYFIKLKKIIDKRETNVLNKLEQNKQKVKNSQY